MSHKNLGDEVLLCLHQLFLSLGFRKKRRKILTIPISEDVIGLVGLNKATIDRKTGGVEINPVVGIRNQRLEKLVSDLCGVPFDELSPFSAGANVGYLSPDSRYYSYIFGELDTLDVEARRLVDSVIVYGIPFMQRNVELEDLLTTMRSSQLSIQFITVYRVPVALYMLGRNTEAADFLNTELAKLSSRTDPAAESFRVFAGNLQMRLSL